MTSLLCDMEDIMSGQGVPDDGHEPVIRCANHQW